VKQNEGYIEVQSERGKGSRFHIYLPRTAANVTRTAGRSSIVPKGQKTVLLVEDEPSLIALTTKLLRDLGYNVLPAMSPDEAIRLAQKHSEQIEILLSDVVMPNMNGRALANALLSLHPELQCVFMSGWTADIIEHNGAMGSETFFLQKPFTKQQLAEMLQRAAQD